MKSMNAKLGFLMAGLLAMAVPVIAQTAAGSDTAPPPAALCAGRGPGAGCGPAAGGMMGMGGGMMRMGGMGQMGMRFGQNNTPGWSLMTPEERNAHRNQMMSAKSYEECRQIQAAQHALMETRAKEKGITLPTPRQNGCDRMRARGMFQ